MLQKTKENSNSFISKNDTPNEHLNNNDNNKSNVFKTEIDLDLEASASSGNMDSVITCCQTVVHTTLSLMYWAAAAQRELVQQGKMKPIDLVDDCDVGEVESQWAQGLVSAVSQSLLQK